MHNDRYQEDVRYLRRYKVEETETELPIQGQVRGPNDLYKFLHDIQDNQVDKIVGIYLDDNLLFLGHQVFIGTTSKDFDTQTFYHYYNLFLAKKFMLIVNHPSGDPTPTEDDRELMRSLKMDSAILSFKPTFADFVIVGGKKYFSMAENEGTACRCGHQHYFED